MKSKRILILFIIIIISLLTVSYDRAYSGAQREETSPSSETPKITAPPTLEQVQYSFRQVAQSVLPVVVEINTIAIVSQPRIQSPWDFFLNPSPPGEGDTREREFKQPGLGSGVLVRKNGSKVYVLTNNHVVGNADEIMVRLYDEREFKAKLVGTDPRRDLAVIVFETKEEIPIARLGDSDKLQVGDLVLAVGNPFGFESTVTSGIVSALGRKAEAAATLAQYTDYIQTDAAINPGNSGGALVNLWGEVIGLNTWIASQTGYYAGLGFAVPINNAKKAIDDFITKGKVEYGWLGVQIGDIDPRINPHLQEELKIENVSGAFIFNVFKGSPAYKAGILPGDYIVKADNQTVRDADHLTHIIGDLPPGNKTVFELMRSGKNLTVSTKLTVRKEEKEATAQSKNLWPGMSVASLTDEIKKQLKLPSGIKGILVYNVIQETPSAIAGFKQGDVIKKINDKDINSPGAFYQVMNDANSKEFMMRVFRDENEILIGLVK